MRSNPKHVLVGELESHDILVKAQSASRSCQWRVPKDSKRGDVVLLLIGRQFVGEAIIRKDAQATDVSGRYSSTIGNIRIWGEGVAVEAMVVQLPEWKYLTYPKTYTSVRPELQASVRDAINYIREGSQNSDDERGDIVPPTTTKVLSVPAAGSADLTEITKVYACLDVSPYTSYQDFPLWTFRHHDGMMKHVYVLKWRGALDWRAVWAGEKSELHQIPAFCRSRVRQYIRLRTEDYGFGDGPFMFYVFSEDPEILEFEKPLTRNLQGRCYVWLEELRSEKEIVSVASQTSTRGRRSVPRPKGVLKPSPSTENVIIYPRDSAVKVWVLAQSKGVCECCGQPAPFEMADGTPFLEVHHVRGLADGGSDTVENVVAICPNCHRELHYGANARTLVDAMYLKVKRLVQE